MGNDNFWIYRSSAGSGKTYTLTREYLALAFQHPFYFRNILAVTFTNKATHEMKSRIIHQLHQLAEGASQDDALKAYLRQTTDLDEPGLQQRARDILVNLLHHYSHFSVTTIDSFFQKVIRSFSREVGLRGGFNIELDEDKVLDEIVDMVYDELGQNKTLTRWILDFSIEKLEEGSAWDVRGELKKLGREIFKEQFKKLVTDRNNTGTNAEQLLKEIRKRFLVFERKLKTYARDAITLMRRQGVDIEDFAYKSGSVPSYFRKIMEGNFEPGQRQLSGLDNVETWTGKNNDQKEKLQNIVQSGLQEILRDCIDYYQKNYTEYLSLREIKRFFYAFGIIEHLREKLNFYREEQEVMLISDASDFLREVTRQNDTPFIYEKVGSRFHNFLIDEFQDTSTFQWENLRPLIFNGLSEGKRSLIVGDVKQSIYRWRGGEWELLLKKIGQDIDSRYCREVNLDQNWRSRENLVWFNNSVFQNLPRTVIDFISEKNGNFSFLENIEIAYQDALQKITSAQKSARAGGKVKVQFFEGENNQEEQDSILKNLVVEIETLQKQGYEPKDVTILVRKAKDGIAIASYLMQYKQTDQALTGFCYDIVTSEALLLGQSVAIRLIIQAMKYLANPDDHLARVGLNYEYNLFSQENTSLHQVFTSPDSRLDQELNAYRQLPLLDLVESLVVFFEIDHFQEAFPFLQTFQDQVMKYTSNYSAGLVQFLEWWEENGSRVTVPMSEQLNAFQIMTIHKSKGLQFKVVLIPFCSWSLDHDAFLSNILWCGNKLKLNSDATALPLRYSSGLAKTIWAEEYLEEKVRAFIDNLNLLYVAFTRAIDQVIVSGGIRRYASGLIRTETVADFLYLLLSPNDHAAPELLPYWKANGNLWQFGEDVKQTAAEVGVNANALVLTSYITSSWQDKIKIKKYRKDLFSSETEKGRKINFGNLMHEMLSKVKVSEDLDRVVKMAEIEGIVDHEESLIIKEKFNQLKEDESSSWIFEPGYQVKLELPLLPAGGEIKRPDRVMIKGDEAIVIDYKTGMEHGSDLKQVKEYAELVKQMGYSRVSGFLLYLDNLRMQRVI